MRKPNPDSLLEIQEYNQGEFVFYKPRKSNSLPLKVKVVSFYKFDLKYRVELPDGTKKAVSFMSLYR